jgi:DNA-binding transcriptional regulator WhiA
MSVSAEMNYVSKYIGNKLEKIMKIKLNSQVAELCGIIIGDGNLWTNNRKYEITITGSPKDRRYMDAVEKYFTVVTNRNMYYRQRGRGLRISLYSKDAFVYFTEVLGIKIGKEKGSSTIPSQIIRNRDYCLAFIRGLFDTDGSIFLSSKPGVTNYPSIEITNKNRKLLVSIKEILEREGMRVTIRASNTNTNKIAIHGRRMIKLWRNLIGSSHPRKLTKMESIIKTCS